MHDFPFSCYFLKACFPKSRTEIRRPIRISVSVFVLFEMCTTTTKKGTFIVQSALLFSFFVASTVLSQKFDKKEKGVFKKS